jgi:hypothetical protein
MARFPMNRVTRDLDGLIPPEWVGLESPVSAAAASVIASPAEASLELVTPVPGPLERGACVLEPGKRCRSTGRCRQMGH